jgi:DNA-binding response OmpR family regulator
MTVEVLVVEDHPDIAYPLTRTLEREGYDVTWVENGRDAIESSRARTTIDLIILDLGLPDMDGLEVCKSGPGSGGFEGGIMICSARGDELDRVVGLDYGADDYLPKPFGLAELQARARALLRRTGNQRWSMTPARRS